MFVGGAKGVKVIFEKKQLKLDKGLAHLAWPHPGTQLWGKLEAVRCEGFDLAEPKSPVLVSDFNYVYRFDLRNHEAIVKSRGKWVNRT